MIVQQTSAPAPKTPRAGMSRHVAWSLVFGLVGAIGGLSVSVSELGSPNGIVALIFGGVAFAGGYGCSLAVVWMRLERRRVATVALLIFAGMGLWPPWVYTEYRASVVRPAGYHLIFAPPSPDSDRHADGVRIDTGRLLLQWTVLAAVVGALAPWRYRRDAADAGELLLNKPADKGQPR